ncbi:MAG: pantoate--beta-alanine ligase [Bacteroidetes bacterium]|nr:pantoate--beta-alanine ligase [Bacteroidota bacterium]
MKFLSINELVLKIGKILDQNQTVGYVPTMGALHEGHLSIIQRASIENDIVVVSIFVNPTQFNNVEDLVNYPRTLDEDLKLMAHVSNLFVVQPEVSQVYSEKIPYLPFDIGRLSRTLEGEFRPGHFDGVVHVLHNLFHLIKPSRAYFGKKDFQQLTIVRMLVKHYQFPIEVVACETFRSKEGLALSSRNRLLSLRGMTDALIIWQTLNFVKEKKYTLDIKGVKKVAKDFFSTGNLKLEYLELVNENTLMTASTWEESVVCFIAAYCEDVRLIDNMLV